MEYFVYQFQSFFLVLVRMTAMMMIAPFFSSGVIPLLMRGALSFFVSLVIFPLLSISAGAVTGNMGVYYLMVVQEIIIGLYIGFLVSVVFSAFQLSAQYFAVQIGFGINEVIDPLAQVSIPLIGQLKNFIGLLVFLTINGHHFMIKAIYNSYELAPAFGLKGDSVQVFLKFLVHSFSGMFVIALKISLPVIAVVFLMSVSMGILAKAAPQMNIMMLGFPFKIAVAFGMMILISPLIVRVMNVSLERTFQFIVKVIRYWPV